MRRCLDTLASEEHVSKTLRLRGQFPPGFVRFWESGTKAYVVPRGTFTYDSLIITMWVWSVLITIQGTIMT